MARRFSSGRCTDYSWSGGSQIAAMASGTATALVVVTFNTPLTLMRVRGEAVASIDGPVDGDKATVAAGLIVVTEE